MRANEVNEWCDPGCHHFRCAASGEAAAVDSAVYLALMEKVGEDNSPLGVGPDCVASSHLPSHSDVHMSYLTGKRIQVNS